MKYGCLRKLKLKDVLYLYLAGKKNDNWFMVDWRTGWKEELLNVDNTEDVCPLLNRNSMFVGRTGKYESA